MSARGNQAGFSYIEVLMASIIMSVLLTAGVHLFGNIGRSVNNTTDAVKAASLAVDLIREIKDLNYSEYEGDANLGIDAAESGADRYGYDDIDDYNNYSSAPPKRRDGNVYDNCDDLTHAISVSFVAANDFSQEVGADEGFKKVVITVYRDNIELA